MGLATRVEEARRDETRAPIRTTNALLPAVRRRFAERPKLCDLTRMKKKPEIVTDAAAASEPSGSQQRVVGEPRPATPEVRSWGCNHFWSLTDWQGMQECLWCRETRYTP